MKIVFFRILSFMFSEKLHGKKYRLESLGDNHQQGLIKSGNTLDLWELIKPKKQDLTLFLKSYFQSTISSHKLGDHHVYVVIDNATNNILGTTRYYEISRVDKRLCIGFTWYHPSVWGSGINAEVKHLLLAEVFEKLRWNRVGFHVDSRNKRSLSAMAYLGGVKEGIMRKHRIVQGDYVRDTIILSIIKEDWPEVKQRLLVRTIGVK